MVRAARLETPIAASRQPACAQIVPSTSSPHSIPPPFPSPSAHECALECDRSPLLELRAATGPIPLVTLTELTPIAWQRKLLSYHRSLCFRACLSTFARAAQGSAIPALLSANPALHLLKVRFPKAHPGKCPGPGGGALLQRERNETFAKCRAGPVGLSLATTSKDKLFCTRTIARFSVSSIFRLHIIHSPVFVFRTYILFAGNRSHDPTGWKRPMQKKCNDRISYFPISSFSHRPAH